MVWNGWQTTANTEKLWQLHKAIASRSAQPEQAFALIATHCEIVARLAEIIARVWGKPLDSEHKNLLIEGALAHDIGTYSVLDDSNFTAQREPIFQRGVYIQHGVRGYELLRKAGFSEDIAQFARNHTGVGITYDDCLKQSLAIPAADYTAQSTLQAIVMLADKFHTKSLPARFVSEDAARTRCAKFGAENLHRWDKLVAEYGVPTAAELTKLASEYAMDIIEK
ncbi:HD domain-containing protein [Alloscardovia criceti]|uniref:HD domain-containing protein n=1 Tax=Alloscardovia criceti TaxID=356828 RepID=UPI000379D69D|nr:HD domain-containing protein [Alloscardovia criceti]